MSTEQPLTDLVTRARNGDKQAWDALVERYAPLIWSICRRHRLDGADADDVGQSVWLLLADHLGNLRDPAALPGWLATTTRQECGRVLHAARGPLTAGHAPDPQTLPGEQAATADQELLAAERHAALRQALGELPPGCQRLIALLTADPPVPYAQISARLGIPVGGGLLAGEDLRVGHVPGRQRSPGGAQYPAAFPARRGGQPAGKRGRVAEVTQMIGQEQPDALADGLGVRAAEPVPAADRPGQRGVPLDQRVPRLLVAVPGPGHQVGDRLISTHEMVSSGHVRWRRCQGSGLPHWN